MSQHELTETAVEELLSGRARPEDVAPELRRLADFLGELSTIDAGVGRQAKHDVVPKLAGIVGNGDRASAKPTPLVSRRRVFATAAIAACSACLVFGGLGAANALPDGAQRTVSDILANVGVHVPRPSGPGDGNGAPVPSTAPSSDTSANGSKEQPVLSTSPGNPSSPGAANEKSPPGGTTPPGAPAAAPAAPDAPTAAVPAPAAPLPDTAGPPYGNGKGLGPGNGKGLGPGNGNAKGHAKPPA